MTTSEQAALLAKHHRIKDDGTPGAALYAGDCFSCEWPFPCDVHRMAELKDAEIAELRRENGELALKLALRSGDVAALKSEREAIVKALEEEPEHGWMLAEGYVEHGFAKVKEEIMLKRRVIDIVRSFSSEGEDESVSS